MTPQAALDRSERLEAHGTAREVFALHLIVNALPDDERLCAALDELLAHWDAADAVKAAAVEAELAAPACVTCGGVAPGHSLVCPHYLAERAGTLVTT